MAPKQSKPRSKLPYWVVAFVLAGVLLYYSLKGIQWGQVWETLSRAKPGYIAVACLVITLALFLRAIRWRVLLRSQAPVDVPSAFWATAAGYFGNNFLPARAGEIVRSLMVSSRWGLSKAFVLTTALSERICDAIVLVVGAALVLLALPVKPGWFRHAATPFGIIGFCGVLGIALLPKLERLWAFVLQKLPLPEGLRDKLSGILGHVLTGIRTFHDARRLSAFVALTGVIWFCDSAGTVIGMRALGLEISIPVAFLLITGLGLGSALPSTPGYVGIYQFVAVSVLTPFGFSKANAIAYILLAQALQYVIISFWGLLALTRQKGVVAKATAEAEVAATP